VAVHEALSPSVPVTRPGRALPVMTVATTASYGR
jgi:hypothetical protein